MKKQNTRRALLASALSLLLCVSMLVGTTFAWFTDSVSSGRNQIVAGNLDVTLEYWNGSTYAEVTGDTKLFNDAALWEPGHTEVAYLKVGNAGSLALLYQLAVHVYDESQGTNVAGDTFALSDHLVFSVVDKEIETAADLFTREEAITEAGDTKGLKAYSSGEKALLNTGDADYVALIIYMPESVGNEANYMTGTLAPYIQMGATLVATQYAKEQDSFGADYDAEAVMPIPVIPDGDTPVSTEPFSFIVPAAALADGVTALMPPTISEPQFTETIPTDTTTNKIVTIDLDIKMEGIRENNTTPITVKYRLPDDKAYCTSIEAYHNGELLPNVTYDAATKTVTFTTTSFSPFKLVLDTGATVIPESYTNEEAIALLKNAASGAVIDGLGKTYNLGSIGENQYAITIGTKDMTFRNMTLKASGKGYVLQIDAKGKTVKMQNVTFQNTTGKTIVLSYNGKESVELERCTFKGGAFMHGSNVTVIDCTFTSNINMEDASNYTIKNCKFTASSAITMNASLKDILFVGNTFKSVAVRLYKGMPQPTNVRFIGNTYGTKIANPDTGVDYEGWKAAGVWIETDNVKG